MIIYLILQGFITGTSDGHITVYLYRAFEQINTLLKLELINPYTIKSMALDNEESNLIISTKEGQVNIIRIFSF